MFRDMLWHKNDIEGQICDNATLFFRRVEDNIDNYVEQFNQGKLFFLAICFGERSLLFVMIFKTVRDVKDEF